MIRLEKLKGESFLYKEQSYRSAFPGEYFLSFEEERLTGFCRINLLDQSIEECRADSPLLEDALRRCALDFFLESGCEEVLDAARGTMLSAREGLCGTCTRAATTLQAGRMERNRNRKNKEEK